MKHMRIIAIFLIMTLAASPALAVACGISCVSTKSVMAAEKTSDMSAMTNCHEGSMNKKETQSTTEHKSCTMGAGCHFSQVTPIDSSSHHTLIESATVSFPELASSAKSADLSPPLKPPA